MAKKKEEQKQEEKTTVEEVGVNPTNDIEQEKPKAEETPVSETPVSETPVSKTQKCGRCGAKIVDDGHQCPVCMAPTSWER